MEDISMMPITNMEGQTMNNKTVTAGHTAGVWTVIPYGRGKHFRIESEDGTPIVEEGFDLKEANACLIASAPELLRALKDLQACHRAFSSNDNWTILDDEARVQAEMAIAKAEGR